MPSVTNTGKNIQAPVGKGALLKEPLQLSGVLSGKYKSIPLTPDIGDEYPDASLKEILNAPNADELIRDLAITVSRRGVVFFRNQDITFDQQKHLAQRLGELTGKPESSKLHTHPMQNSYRDSVGSDDVLSIISTAEAKKYQQGPGENKSTGRKKSAATQWHTDIVFEPVPSDYAVLQMHTLPSVGGDTLWATAYGIYDHLGEKYAKFLEGLVAHYAVHGFQLTAEKHGFEVHKGPRGSPENAGDVIESFHPLVRTNPVTGWKAVYGTGAQDIEGLTVEETQDVLKYIQRIILENHDLTVRFKWNEKDVAIWDNRSTLHTATSDFDFNQDRTGYRVLSIGEKPYLDPNSIGRHQSLRHADQ